MASQQRTGPQRTGDPLATITTPVLLEFLLLIRGECQRANTSITWWENT